MSKPRIPRLEECLIKVGADPNKVRQAMREYYSHDEKRAGEYCMSVGACTPSQLAQALAIQCAFRGERSAAEAWLQKQSAASDRHLNRIDRSVLELREMSLRFASGKAKA